MKNFLLLIASVGILALAALMVFHAHHPQKQRNEANFSVVQGVNAVHAIAVDMDGSNDLTAQRVLKGGDAVLVLNLKSAPPSILELLEVKNSAVTYAFDDLGSLEKFDTDKNFIIDGADPIYPALELVSFFDGKISNRSTAFAVGIRAINLNPEYLAAEEQYDDTRFDKIAATVVLADGSRRVVKIIPLDISVFNEG